MAPSAPNNGGTLGTRSGAGPQSGPSGPPIIGGGGGNLTLTGEENAMERKWVFLIVCTIAHPVVFVLCAAALMCLRDRMPPEALYECGRALLQVMLPLLPVFTGLFSGPSAHKPALSLIVFFFLSNGLLWALSLWYARAAWRRLRNLPPVRQLS